MKRYIPLLALLLASLLYPQDKMDINNLIERDSLLYAPNDDKPFTGNVFDFYDSGKKSEDGRYRNGLKNGKWTYWFKNGQKWREETYKDGELISEKCWDEDGNEMECWDENETEPPGNAPPNKVWSPEHGHWHDAPATSTPIVPQSSTGPTSEPPGPAPPGKVWSPEHGHWHDAP